MHLCGWQLEQRCEIPFDLDVARRAKQCQKLYLLREAVPQGQAYQLDCQHADIGIMEVLHAGSTRQRRL